MVWGREEGGEESEEERESGEFVRGKGQQV